MLLMIDNYDSFTYNLVHLFEELGAEVRVFRNDAITVDEAEALEPTHLVISPGPGRPADAGVSVELIRAARPARADARRLPRPPGDRRGLRRRGRPGAGARCTGSRRSSTTTARASSPACAQHFEAGRYHSLAAIDDPRRARGDGPHAGRRGDGRAPPRAPDRGRPVPPRERADAARPRPRGGTSSTVIQRRSPSCSKAATSRGRRPAR